ncbi:type IX secretion system protein PorQ [bacterium SCSIO 12741]|nr:type IX secretion system protein PorQ [bacterium SCSIO 12741]
MRILFVFLMFFATTAHAQIGGNSAAAFLSIPVAARPAAMGGSAIGFKDTDVNLVYDNPANLDTLLDNQLALNYINFIGDINAGNVYYARRMGNGALGVGLQFMSYGKFDHTEANGQVVGQFTAGDYALNVGWGRSFDSIWSVGANVKMIYSTYADYRQFGVGVDVGGSYWSRDRNFSAGIVMKDLGTMLTKNDAGNRENLPWNVSIGISEKIPKAPLRFFFQYHHLEKWDLGSNDPDYRGKEKIDPKTGETSKRKFSTDNFFRHVVFGGEIIPHKNMYVTIAYNFRRHRELSPTARSGLSGMSFGAGIKIKRLRFQYTLASYHLGGNSHHIGVSTSLNEYLRKL